MSKPLRQGQMVVRGDIVAVDGPPLPAIRKAPNRFKRFRMLCELADQIVEEHERLWAMHRSLWRRSDEPLPDVEDAQLPEGLRKDIGRCRELIKEIDREDRYEEDEEGDRVLKKTVVAERLALMFGNARVGGAKSSEDAEASAEMVVAHVFDAEVSYLVLEGACRELEATQKFVPATAEVLEKISEHQSLWFRRQHAIGRIESTSRELQNEIRQAHAKFEAEKAEAKIKRAEFDLRNRHNLVSHAKQQVISKQESLRKWYQEAEAAMARLAEAQKLLEEAYTTVAEALEARARMEAKRSNAT
jgi:hypothetical protein